MKLPWDEKYLKICFHVIFTLIVVYILMVLVDTATFMITNINQVLLSVGDFFNGLIRVFSVVIIAFIIAYLFDPAVDFFQKKYEEFYVKFFIPTLKKNKFTNKWSAKLEERNFSTRFQGTLILYIIFIGSLSALICFLFMQIGATDFDSLTENLGTLINNTVTKFNDTFALISVKLAKWDIMQYVDGYIANFANIMRESAANIVSGISSIGGSIVTFLVSIIIAFYMLKDKNRITAKIIRLADKFLPKKSNQYVKNIFSDIHLIFSGYIRGQITDAFIMSVLLSTYLSIIRLDFAIIIGILSGISNLIPYFGAIICFLLAVVVAFLSGEPMKALYAAMGILVLQQIDAIFIVPRVVGKNVELSPMMVLISLAVGGELFGITGLIFAVPVCGIIKLLLHRIKI